MIFTNSAAQEAKEMAAKVTSELGSHVAVCLDNQRRIENRFTGIDTKLDKQNDTFDRFRESMTGRLDAIKSSDNKRYAAMMGVAMTTLAGIGVQILFHYWR